MHFIEEIFNTAPDGGSGLLELAIVVAFLVLPFAALALRRTLAQTLKWPRKW
jgi:hypothetical protein